MYTYTTGRNWFGSLVKDDVAATLVVGDGLINQQIKRLLGKKNWSFLERTKDITFGTTAFKPLPVDCKKVKTLYVTIGSYRHTPKECTSREMWDALNRSTYTSDIPQYYFVFQGQLGLFPTPATTGNIATVTYTRKHKDLTIADYSTGTIATATLGSTAIVGSGTTFTASMVGRAIQITETNAALGGDGFWYEIDTYTSATSIGLTQLYAGTSIAAGSAAYTIGQTSIIPEEYQDVPVLGAVYMYYKTIKPETDLAKEFKDEFTDRYNEMVGDYGQKNTSPVIDDGTNNSLENPNFYVTL